MNQTEEIFSVDEKTSRKIHLRVLPNKVMEFYYGLIGLLNELGIKDYDLKLELLKVSRYYFSLNFRVI